MPIETDNLETIRDFIRWGTSRFTEAGLFFGHGTDNALDEAVMMVLGVLRLPPDLPAQYLESRLTAHERRTVLDVFQRRICERIPAAYLLGEAWFAGFPFFVNEQVLVPRSPIAELVENRFSPWIDDEAPRRILDLCTGSGCIGIACAHHFPEAEVDLVDISTHALEVARRNIERHEIGEQVRAIRSDLFDGLGDQTYDIIVCNPPYVSREQLIGLPPEYGKEPILGLQADEAGLALVKRILREASEHMIAGGILVVEVGLNAEALMDAYPAMPFMWLDFERGGDGVFLLTAEQLDDIKAQV